MSWRRGQSLLEQGAQYTRVFGFCISKLCLSLDDTYTLPGQHVVVRPQNQSIEASISAHI
ncbi:hypothetical protein CERSUDRAFT_86341 [Gelatoporia subvermispora B]|uniref:Uncharacterized protein n=1 Tax=Ceriporiopsis subvermispora (strain B) TaxID=914234 RepID=M2QB23_CERS8|nr:hypothetical protein CERSUDRAFT_86341 [Gelatoporia subvermispora B]